MNPTPESNVGGSGGFRVAAARQASKAPALWGGDNGRRAGAARGTREPRADEPTPAAAAVFLIGKTLPIASRRSGDGLRSISFERLSTGLSNPDAANRLATSLDAFALNYCKPSTDEAR
jgi:hypothetical protein